MVTAVPISAHCDRRTEIQVSDSCDTLATMSDGSLVVGGRTSAAKKSVNRICDVLLVAACVGSVGMRLSYSRHAFFSGDDWPAAWMGLSLHGFIEPYNGHLSITFIAGYRVFAELFGINNILPLRIFAELAFAAIAVILYCIVRSRVGSWWALPAAVAVLFYPDAVVVISAFNHYLALIGGLLVAWMLTRDERRFDPPIFVVLCFALASSSVAVAAAMGCVVFLIFTRPHWRRWVAVIVPCALWVVWYLRYEAGKPAAAAIPLAQVIGFVWRGIASGFVALGFDNHVLGALLGIGFVAVTVWRCRAGWRAAAHPLSWSAAACGWWLALSQYRLDYPSIQTIYRYRLVTSIFIILAFLPTDQSLNNLGRQGRWKSWTAVQERRAVFGGLVASVLVSVLLVTANPHFGSIGGSSATQALRPYYLLQEASANQGPRVVSDSSLITGPFFTFPVGHYRAVVRAYGYPTGSRPANFDQFVLTTAKISLRVTNNPKALYCRQQHQVLVQKNLRLVLITAQKEPVNVRIRLLGHAWTDLGTIEPGQRGSISFVPIPIIKQPWQIQAAGSCVGFLKEKP